MCATSALPATRSFPPEAKRCEHRSSNRDVNEKSKFATSSAKHRERSEVIAIRLCISQQPSRRYLIS